MAGSRGADDGRRLRHAARRARRVRDLHRDLHHGECGPRRAVALRAALGCDCGL